MRIANPLMLLLLFFIPLLFYYRRRFKLLLRSTIRFSDSDFFKGVKPSFKIRLRNKLVYLRILALVLLVIAASRPQSAIEETRIYVEGVDIVLAIDTSTSMYAMDFELDGRRVNRLDAVKRVVSKFIERRTNDRIGIVAFASYAYTVCPLTLDHVWLEKNLERIHIGMIKDGTAIGSAIAGSLNRLKDTKAKEKIIILLTDGRNNSGNISPLVAAETAQALGVKIYTIGAGTKGLAPFPVQDVFGNTVLRPVKVEIDDKLLKKIAKATDAEYFRATDTNSLEDIYERIDKLEKTKIEETGYNIYKELFGYFLMLGLIFLLLGIFLSNTIFRRIP
jgi:Ca-activated chloride channel homolog